MKTITKELRNGMAAIPKNYDLHGFEENWPMWGGYKKK